MAPSLSSKRGRSEDDSDKFKGSEVEEVTSSLRRDSVSQTRTLSTSSQLQRRMLAKPGQRKRVRLSEETNTNLPTNAVVDISDDQESDVSSDTEDETPAPHNNDPAQVEESEDEDLGGLDDATATQRVRERYEKNAQRENHAADNAIIEEIECRNFMCHSHLKIKVGPLINFIIGHNGSGKSAVLTALTICLGGKATATNRGQALKSFIKEGTDAASLSVKIKNQGHTAFKPDVYGRSIIVERHFSRNGVSGFKIKTEMGRLVTTKKSELEEILDAFALQLDNPMNVLTQDMARQFLNSSSASDKYKFFLKGTHLEDLDRDYRLMAETLSSNGERIKLIEETCSDLKQVYERAEEKLKLSSRQQSLRDTMDKYSRQMAWAQVAEQEGQLKMIDEEIRGADAEIQKRTNKFNAFGNQLDEAQHKMEKIDDVIKALQLELQPHVSNKDKETETFTANRDTLMELQHEQRDLKDQIEVATSKVKKLQENIEEEKRKLANANDGQHAQRLEEIQDAKEAADQAKIRLEEHRAGFIEVNNAVKLAEARLNDVNPQKEAKEKEVKEAQTAFPELQSGSRDWMSCYHASLRQLLRLISQETRFKEKPVGPLGRHVTLLKPEWSSILEQSFGGSLNGFAVTSRHDQSILSELIKRVGYEGRIFIGNSAPLDTSGHEPDASLLTWMRALKIDNDLVRNQMIINQGIDQTVLAKNRQEAVDLVNRKPRNVKQIFSMHDERREDGGLRWGWSMSGAPNSSPISGWGRRRPRMQANTQDRIEIAREQLDRVKSELHELENRSQQARKELTQANQTLVRFRRDTKIMIEDQQRLETRVNELQDSLEEDTPQTGTLEQYQADLEKEIQERNSLAEQFELAVEEKTRLNHEQRTLKDKMDAIGLDIKDLEAQIEKNNRRKGRFRTDYDNILLQRNEASGEIETAKRHKEELQEGRRNQETTVASFTEQATRYCERVRVDPGETPKSLDVKLEKLAKEMHRAQQEVGGTREELQMRFAEAKHHWKRKVRELASSRELDRLLKKAMDERQRRWKVFRSLISLRASGSFTYLLSERQFRGELIFLHTKKLLDIKVRNRRSVSLKRMANTHYATGRARYYSLFFRRSSNQDSKRRRKVLQHHLSAPLALGGHGIAHPVLGRVRRFHG